jgi:glyoxylase-like metal-dependent hydrolase (beta-lactamase superfamily II)
MKHTFNYLSTLVALVLSHSVIAGVKTEDNTRALTYEDLSFETQDQSIWGKGHKNQQGLVFAQQVNVTRGGNPHLVVTNRQVQFNPAPANIFALPNNYQESPASMDMSSMTVQEITEGVYLAGKDWGYSVFVDTGEGFIAAGGYSKLMERFDAVKSFAKIDKPLQKVVVSHHHRDHIQGMPEAIELGATLIAVEQHVNTVKAVINTSSTNDNFDIVENTASFADGKVIVIDMPSAHSSHNLMTYIPAAKLLFRADTYFSRQVGGVPFGGADLQKISQRLHSLDLEVDKFAAAHSARILTAADFEASKKKVFEPVCPVDWAICQVMKVK